MANSNIIGKAKNKIIRELIKDQNIIAAIGGEKDLKPEQYINKHIFNFNQNPYTINTVTTFITVQVHIPQSLRGLNLGDTFVTPTIEIWIISHEKHMVVDNIPKITDNRNDYLSELIDEKLNGRSDFGIDKLVLKSNIEGSFQQDYLFRKLIFECKDLNDSLCSDE